MNAVTLAFLTVCGVAGPMIAYSAEIQAYVVNNLSPVLTLGGMN